MSVLDAAVNLKCVRRVRSVPISEFVTGVKKTRLTKDELNTSISIPVADGSQEFRQFRLVCPDHSHHAIEPKFEFLGVSPSSQIAPKPSRSWRRWMQQLVTIRAFCELRGIHRAIALLSPGVELMSTGFRSEWHYGFTPRIRLDRLFLARLLRSTREAV